MVFKRLFLVFLFDYLSDTRTRILMTAFGYYYISIGLAVGRGEMHA